MNDLQTATKIAQRAVNGGVIRPSKVLLVLIILSTLFALAVSVTILVNAYCGGWRLMLIRLTLRWNLPDWLRAILWGWY